MNSSLEPQKRPNVMLIGAQKAGTTSVFDWIAQHPQVYALRGIKDYPYFWNEAVYSKGVEAYESWFRKAGDQPVILAGNVNDLFFENVPKRIFEYNPNVKFIVCLRDPVERAYSAYAYAVERGLEERTFNEAIREELRGISYQGVVEQSQKYYYTHGLYSAQIERYLTYFRRENMHFIFFRDIKERPLVAMQEVFQFLSIERSFTPDFKKKNETKGSVRFKIVDTAIFEITRNRPLWYRVLSKIISPNFRYKLREILTMINRKRATKPNCDPEAIQLLREAYKEDIEKLSVIVGRDLSKGQA